MAQAARTFRLFVSSTFSDLEPERNALQKRVFPELRRLCAARGARFQAIDLRWGVPDEAGLDHRTIPICLEEVDRCRAISPRPNFLILLGDRYGWRPLPPELPADEFQEVLSRAGGRRPLLETWYRLDLNAIAPPRPDRRPREHPGVYCLRPRSGRFADFAVWEREVERPLREVLHTPSATELEIARGALQAEDAPGHVFGFFRTISGLPRDRRGDGWVDVNPDGTEDTVATGMLADLKGRLGLRLPGNVRTCSATWTRSLDLSDPPPRGEVPISTDHLDGLCADVLAALSNVIQAELERLETVEPLEKEIAEHEAFRRGRTRVFLGREASLRTITDYLARPGRAPLAVHGASGAGKSALMARAIEQARDALPGAITVARFIGWTPRSADIRALLDGVCREVSRASGADEDTIPDDYRELVRELPRRLALATAARPVVVFLDALDQLADADQARQLGWLPAELPPHAALVVSTTPGDTLAALGRVLPAERLIRVEDMPPAEADSLLSAWLGEAGRALTPRQRGLVLERFAGSPWPLYLKLAFEEARRWRAWADDPAPAVTEPLAADIPGLIRQLFARLADPAHHGPVLTRRALGYLGAAKNGLTEDELLDVLALDRVARGDFTRRARHAPPEPRLPVAVWSRLWCDLEPYLTERYADGANLLTFYHRQLLEVIQEDYLAGREGAARHWLLSRYFRRQPLGTGAGESPNLRKLSELPWQLTLGEQWGPLYDTLTDFDFLEAKCTYAGVREQGAGGARHTVHAGVYELQEDFRLALERMPAG